MNQDKELQLIDVCKQYVKDRRTTVGASEPQVDVSRYRDVDRFDLELERVFRQLPSMLLHSTELEKNNRFQSVTTPVGSLIVSRDSAGKVHVFRNACRHRGAQLVAGKGCSKLMVCPYHAWGYGTDGQLLSVPSQSSCFPDLTKADNGLIEMPSVEKYGFIWLCPSVQLASAESHLDQHLADMVSQLVWLEADNLQFYQRTVKTWQGNWKLFAEGGLETYHFAFAHRQSIAPYFYQNTAVIDSLPPHFRVVMPTKALQNDEVSSLHDCSHTLFFIMPSAALLVQKQHVDWIQFRPLAVDKTEIAITSLVPQSADLSDDEQQQHWAKNHGITNQTLDEDWTLGESIQQTINDGALTYIQYGNNEWALAEFNRHLQRLLFV